LVFCAKKNLATLKQMKSLSHAPMFAEFPATSSSTLVVFHRGYGTGLPYFS
jgi:hypothetical protein